MTVPVFNPTTFIDEVANPGLSAAEMNKLGQGVATAQASANAASGAKALAILYAGLAIRAIAPCRVVFVGSSTVEGNNATTAANRFVNRVVAGLQAAYPSGLGTESAVVASNTTNFGTPSTAAGVHGYNGGLGGTTSANYLDATKRSNIAALSPRAIFHQVGSNDFAQGIAPATYRANLLANLDDLDAKIASPHVHILVHPYARTDVASPAYPWAEYGKVMRDIAAERPDRVVFIDLSAMYELVGIPGSDPFNLLDTDNVHQTNAGHALMADILLRRIEVKVAAAAVANGGTGGGGTTPDPGTGTGGYSFYTDPGVIARWDAATLTALADGAAVDSWAPAAGTELAPLAQTNAAYRPVVTKSVAAIGGKPAVTFTSDFLDTGAWSSTKSTPATVFGVVQIPAAAQTIYTGRNGVYMYSEATAAGMAFGAAAVGQMNVPTAIGWKVFAMVYDGANSRAYVSAATPQTGNTTTTTTNANAALPGLKLGTTSAGTTGVFNGAVAELGVIAGAVTDANVKTALAALATKYGLTLAA